MKFFADSIVKPYIIKSGYRRLCEIGASRAENTIKLLEIGAVEILIIDPCIDVDLSEKFREDKRVLVRKGLSLDVLSHMTDAFDCILIDGDHNWYTVYNELRTIQARGLLREGGTIFFHDVGWPYARRDMYYQPEQIPREFVQPYATKGIVLGERELSNKAEFNSQLFNAIYEGGPRNGVLTAVEDFMKENRFKYRFFRVNEMGGLGVLLKTRNPLGSGVFNKYLIRVTRDKILSRLNGAKNRISGFAGR